MGRSSLDEEDIYLGPIQPPAPPILSPTAICDLRGSQLLLMKRLAFFFLLSARKSVVYV